MNQQDSVASCTIHTCFVPCNFLHLKPLPSSSFKIRFWKSLTMRGSPSLSEILGSQLSNDFALLISGFLLWGSSAVFGLNSIVALGSIVSLTTYITKREKKVKNVATETLSLPLSHRSVHVQIFGHDLQERSHYFLWILKWSENSWIFRLMSQSERQTSASSSIVNSPGLPKLKGPTCSPSISATSPLTCHWRAFSRSSVYVR